ncbi:MAG: hypothetical protein WD576_01875 [Nitriliruptoraceae bacterium]
MHRRAVLCELVDDRPHGQLLLASRFRDVKGDKTSGCRPKRLKLDFIWNVKFLAVRGESPEFVESLLEAFDNRFYGGRQA